MSSQPTANLYIPSEAVVLSSFFTPDVFPSGKRENLNATYDRHSRRRSYGIENTRRYHDVPAASAKNDRRKTIDCGPARPLTPRDDPTQQIARILPQRIMAPRSTTGVQYIWFQSKSEHPDFGVSLADIVDYGAEGLMVAPEERVFQTFGLDHGEIQFSILWPGYGHISWIASIPINSHGRRGHQHGPMTRRLLALVVAQHFQAFVTNFSYLRFPNPDPSWKIMNDRESGIRFENLRLTRLFSHRDEAGRLGSWQAEILVVDDLSTCTRRCIP